MIPDSAIHPPTDKRGDVLEHWAGAQAAIQDRGERELWHEAWLVLEPWIEFWRTEDDEDGLKTLLLMFQPPRGTQAVEPWKPLLQAVRALANTSRDAILLELATEVRATCFPNKRDWLDLPHPATHAQALAVRDMVEHTSRALAIRWPAAAEELCESAIHALASIGFRDEGASLAALTETPGLRWQDLPGRQQEILEILATIGTRTAPQIVKHATMVRGQKKLGPGSLNRPLKALRGHNLIGNLNGGAGYFLMALPTGTPGHVVDGWHKQNR